MEEDTPTSDPTIFPFQLTPEQAQQLNSLTAEQWLKHCQNVRTNHPRNEPAIESFLSLPIEKIVEVFRDAVRHLVASSSPPIDPPTPSPTPSTSTSAPPTPVVLPTEGIPKCPLNISASQLDGYRFYSDRQFLSVAEEMKKSKTGTAAVRSFLTKNSAELIAASLKREVHARLATQK